MEQQLSEGVPVLARLALTTSRACDQSGISLVQYRLLAIIAEEPQRSGKLAERLSVSRPTLTAASRALEDRGLVLREPAPDDGRGIQLRLTPAGEAAIAKAEHAIGEHLLGLNADGPLGDMLAALFQLRGPLDCALRRIQHELLEDSDS